MLKEINIVAAETIKKLGLFLVIVEVPALKYEPGVVKE